MDERNYFVSIRTTCIRLRERRHALFEENVAILRRFPGDDDSENFACAFVECEAFDVFNFFRRDKRVDFCHERIVEGIAGDGRHHDDRVIDIGVQFEQRQDSREQIRNGDAVGAQNGNAERVGGEVGVGENDFIAVPHFTKCFEEIGRYERRDTFEHDKIPFLFAFRLALLYMRKRKNQEEVYFSFDKH